MGRSPSTNGHVAGNGAGHSNGNRTNGNGNGNGNGAHGHANGNGAPAHRALRLAYEAANGNGNRNGAAHAAVLAGSQRLEEIRAYRERARLFKRRGSLMPRMLALADLVALTAVFLLASQIASGGTLSSLGLGTEALLFAVTLPLWLGLAKIYGLYAPDVERAAHSTIDEATTVFHLVTAGSWLLFGVAWLGGVAPSDLGAVFAFWLGSLVAVLGLRALARTFTHRRMSYLQNAVVVGAGDVGQLVARKLVSHWEYGINVVGFVDDDPRVVRDDLQHLAVLGSPDDLPELVTLLDVERVIVAFSNESDERIVALVRRLAELDVQVDIVPRLFELLGPETAIHAAEGVPLVSLPTTRQLPRSSQVLKRAIDLALSIAGLIALAPAFLLVAILIKLDSPGPVFFRQVRIGHRDRPFRIFKFRTMSSDADERKHEVVHLNIHAQNGDPRMFKVPDDPRVTRIGAFLRRYSIDELPQLINVVRGEMSLVGPRPLIVEEDSCITEWARRRLRLKPGVTGLWQALGGSDIPFEEMIRLDYVYVTTWSFWGDLRLICKTIPALMRQRAAY